MFLLMGASGWSFLGGLFVAALVFVFLGLLLNWILCDAGRQAVAQHHAPAPAAVVPAQPAPVAAEAPSAPFATDPATASAPAPASAPAQAEDAAPATLAGPRDGQADNLKEIKGVGPKLEQMLHQMGFYHFDQIAAWTEAEVNWVNENLAGFKGRATRDNWVAQAKILAAGGETEFSARVGKGDVY
ncbi:MAG: NADH:ubiquinone oxidoreductase [Lutimaribacter sp.]